VPHAKILTECLTRTQVRVKNGKIKLEFIYTCFGVLRKPFSPKSAESTGLVFHLAKVSLGNIIKANKNDTANHLNKNSTIQKYEKWQPTWKNIITKICAEISIHAPLIFLSIF
jgi:hypothetical protein